MFTLFKESIVNQGVPDHGGITNSINVWREGTVQNLKVHVDITHPFVGDLSLKLTAPSGKEVTLFSRQGGSADNLVTTFEGNMLADFAGEKALGLWTLRVEDHATRDSGTFNKWGLDLHCEEFKNYRSEVFIPEVGSTNALISTQECRFEGRVTAAEADVEIEHPLIGDLIVTLLSPAGKEVVLHNREGGSQNHLKRHFSSEMLRDLTGQSTKGTWTLRVKNFHGSDNGLLKHWKIKFNYEQMDDLKVVEGIGPKIEKLLNEAGIWSFSTLSATPADTVKGILTAAGDRFAMHNPGTWAHQAYLAANGMWDDLKTLQNELISGKAAVA